MSWDMRSHFRPQVQGDRTREEFLIQLTLVLQQAHQLFPVEAITKFPTEDELEDWT